VAEKGNTPAVDDPSATVLWNTAGPVQQIQEKSHKKMFKKGLPKKFTLAALYTACASSALYVSADGCLLSL